MLVGSVTPLHDGESPANRLRRIHGENIRRMRRLRGLTQAELADHMAGIDCPVTRQAIATWETGGSTPRPHHQAALARVLGIPHAALFPMEAA